MIYWLQLVNLAIVVGILARVVTLRFPEADR